MFLFISITVSADAYLGFEKKVADLLIDFNSPPAEDKQVVIVSIFDQDYADLFKSTSPLSPDVVTRVLDAIKTGEPAVLGVDLFTSDETHKQYAIEKSEFPIVWAEEPVRNENKGIESYKPPLGGQKPGKDSRFYAGLPVLPSDQEGIYRSFRRAVAVRQKNEQNHPTFAWKVYELARPEEAARKNIDTNEYYIRYAGRNQQTDRMIIPASQIIEEFDNHNTDKLKEFLKNKIVLFGGMYEDSRDMMQAPLGRIYGVEMQATIIETELSGQLPGVIPSWARLLINILMLLFFSVNFSYTGINKKSISIATGVVIVLAVALYLMKYGSVSGLPISLLIILYGVFIAILELISNRYKEGVTSLLDYLSSWFARLKKA